MLISDKFRDETIELMVGFMRDELYKGEEIEEEELYQTASIYFDIVNGIATAVEKEDAKRALIAAGMSVNNPSLEGLVDASNPTQVDLFGGPNKVNQAATFKGK